MLTKQSLSKTFNLINNSNITVISCTDNQVSYKLAVSLCSVYFDNAQHYSPKTIDEITATIKVLLSQYERENHCKIELVILNLNQISSEFDYVSFSNTLLELNELSKTENFKAFVLFPTTDTSTYGKAYLSFTKEQAQQILMLSMNTEQPIKLDVETGENKGKRIFYKYDNIVEFFLRETN